MKLLLVASDPMEFRGILNVTVQPRKVDVAVDWARWGTINGHEALLVANGVGRRRAAAAVDAALAVFPAERVISTGFCGAVDPQLLVGGVVVGTFVAAAGQRFRALAVASRRAFANGVVWTIDQVARTAERKRTLRAAGGSVVEMEAAGVAESAETHHVPFSCVRAVTDLAGEDMANDFSAALRVDGHFDTMRIIGDALRHPAARIPELIRLQRRSARAARALGDFFADCRF